MGNILSNNDMFDNFVRKEQVDKLKPIGKEILETYTKVRVDPRTVILVKKENSDYKNNEKVDKKENSDKVKTNKSFQKRK